MLETGRFTKSTYNVLLGEESIPPECVFKVECVSLLPGTVKIMAIATQAREFLLAEEIC